MSITRHPGTIGFGPQNPYAGLNITTLRARLNLETDPAERARLQARIEERRAHNRAGKRKLQQKRAELRALQVPAHE
jgi:hypothetical protein